jgi:hypothetical protein
VSFCHSPFPLTSLELSTGLVFGSERAEEAPPLGSSNDPLAELERAVLPALQRPPCVVSFSGGRDSSVVLAVATSVARREGLPLPVPATNVFPGVPRAAESDWQQRVIDHLRLEDWVRLELRDELDCVGPLAMSILERHGLLWPFNAHFHWPLLEVARGGTLLTGIAGDELLGTSQWARAAAVLSGTVRPSPRDAVRVLVALAPPRARRMALRPRFGLTLPWLTPSTNEELARLMADRVAREPLRWVRRWHWWRSRRETAIGFRSLGLLAADCGTTIEHPLADPAFAASASRHAAARRLYERTAVLQMIFAKLVPGDVLRRASKASFGPVFWGPASRAFVPVALELLGDLETVDAVGLREVWSQEAPDAHSFLMLEAAAVRLASGGNDAAPRGGSGPSFGAVAGGAPAD